MSSETKIIQRRLNRPAILAMLDSIDSTGPGSSIYIPASQAPDKLGEPPINMPEELVEKASASRTGCIIFTGRDNILIVPGLPVKRDAVFDYTEVGPARQLFNSDLYIGVVLVRLGSFSLGTARGEILLSSKTGTGLVHGRHRQGGSSQGRFARHREKQIETFVTRVCLHSREHIEPYARDLDYMLYGGARTTIEKLKKQCAFLSCLEVDELSPLLDIPDPRKTTLEKAVSDIWSANCYQWQWVT